MIADLHCHISTKPMFLKRSDKNCHEILNFDIQVLGCTIDEIIGGDVVDSQSSLQQQFDGNVSFSINPIYGLEQNIGNLKNVGFLKSDPQVDDDVIDNLASTDTLFSDHFDREYTLALSESTGAFRDSINFITPTNKKLVLGKLNVLTAIEGIHTLFASRREYEGVYNNDFFAHFKREIARVFPAYVTVSHMYFTGLFSYCNGSKMSNKVEAQWFMPYDRGFLGLNRNCKRVIDACHANKTSIDVKHTSFANRLAIYEYIHDNADSLPPIASHVGIAYMTFSDYLINNKISISSRSIWPYPNEEQEATSEEKRTVELEIRRNKGPLGLKGNCSQINLFDEDIIAIMSLGGLIGISFDERILGATFWKNATLKQIDHISPEDGNFIRNEYNRIIDKLDIDVPHIDNSQIGFTQLPFVEGILQDIVRVMRDTNDHLDYFIQSILYLLEVGYANDIEKPWRFISLGSDYDGLINAINCCKSSADLADLRTLVINNLHQNKNKNRYKVLRKVEADGIDIIQLVHQIFFFNAVDHFIETMDLDGQEFIENTVTL